MSNAKTFGNHIMLTIDTGDKKLAYIRTTHTYNTGGFYRTTFFGCAQKLPRIVFPNLRSTYYIYDKVYPNVYNIHRTRKRIRILLYISSIIMFIYYYFQFFTPLNCRDRRPFLFSSSVHIHSYTR